MRSSGAKINPKQVVHILKRLPRDPDEGEAAYINRLLASEPAWGSERDIEHNRGVLRDGLPKTKEEDAPPPPKRTLTPAQMEHLFVGTYRDKVLSGLHSTARKEATLAVGHGEKTQHGGGFLQPTRPTEGGREGEEGQGVDLLPRRPDRGGGRRGDPARAEQRGRKLTLYEVTRPAKGRGVKLFRNPEGHFPYFE